MLNCSLFPFGLFYASNIFKLKSFQIRKRSRDTYHNITPLTTVWHTTKIIITWRMVITIVHDLTYSRDDFCFISHGRPEYRHSKELSKFQPLFRLHKDEQREFQDLVSTHTLELGISSLLLVREYTLYSMHESWRERHPIHLSLMNGWKDTILILFLLSTNCLVKC